MVQRSAGFSLVLSGNAERTRKKEPQGLSCEWLFDHPHGVLVLFLFGITEVTAFGRDNAGAFKHLAANEVVDLSGIRAFAERRAFSKVVRV